MTGQPLNLLPQPISALNGGLLSTDLSALASGSCSELNHFCQGMLDVPPFRTPGTVGEPAMTDRPRNQLPTLIKELNGRLLFSDFSTLPPGSYQELYRIRQDMLGTGPLLRPERPENLP